MAFSTFPTKLGLILLHEKIKVTSSFFIIVKAKPHVLCPSIAHVLLDCWYLLTESTPERARNCPRWIFMTSIFCSFFLSTRKRTVKSVWIAGTVLLITFARGVETSTAECTVIDRTAAVDSGESSTTCMRTKYLIARPRYHNQAV